MRERFASQGFTATWSEPEAFRTFLQAEVDKALRDPAFIEIIKTAGGDAVGGSSADFEARIRRDRERLGEVIRLARIKAE